MIEVEVIDLCDFLEKLNTPVDFLKMDIEGAEYPILEKMIATGVYKKIRHCVVFKHADCVGNGQFDEADARVFEN
jgi:FkbM family methyltransferase